MLDCGYLTQWLHCLCSCVHLYMCVHVRLVRVRTDAELEEMSRRENEGEIVIRHDFFKFCEKIKVRRKLSNFYFFRKYRD